MSVTRLIGDVHGHFRAYERLISDCEGSIQVGDMGIGFHHPVTEQWSANPPQR